MLCALAAITATGLGATGAPAAHADATGTPCLWAGNSHRQGQVVYAGGYAFSCHMDAFGNARWNKNGATAHHSTVSNPGAIGNPAGSFSPGAWQPGTSYNDYCSGNQLVDGSADIFSAVTDDTGMFLFWRSVGPISWWDFESGARPPATWRSSSLCRDGALT
ncbi:hypothetical protein NRB20_70170 [Nocardia sp. RB20]|uniref:Uncharacterized protein n=2 Tax=Nocardia macrotermitis TaxID=2585198 RepID=A0A7K0DGH0_9NOCA|nr:hypothetical protein [Nocardia macrotermitis]